MTHGNKKWSYVKGSNEECGNPNESFSDYYHEKIILANRVPVEDGEVVDYIVDGITDCNLQNQARVMQFESHTALLEAFKKVTLSSKKSIDRESKSQPNKS